MKIFVSGSMAYDRIMDFPGRFSDYILPDKIHVLNVCFNVNGLQEKFGGTAGNIAYTLSLLGEKPVILATIGKDFASYYDWLKQHGISTERITVIDSEFTAGAYITTDMSDNQITGFNPGAMKHTTDYDFSGIDPASAVVIIAPGNLKDMIGYAERSRQAGIPYICDPGQSLTLWDGEKMRNWIRGAKFLITNDYELEVIMKMTGMKKADLLGLTGTIITTLGEKGSLIATADGEMMIPPAKVSNVVDPTGAGDAFRSGLLKGLSLGKPLDIAARMGAVAATYAIEQYGTQEHSFNYESFLRRYSDNFGELL